MRLSDYQLRAKLTDRTIRNPEEHKIVTSLGLVGEVGTLSAVYKKFLRDGASYNAFHEHLVEELGDVLWYVASIANRYAVKLLYKNSNEKINVRKLVPVQALADLEQIASYFLNLTASDGSSERTEISRRLNEAVRIVDSLGKSIGKGLDLLILENLSKTVRRWGPPSERLRRRSAPCFDRASPIEERLPRKLRIDFTERRVGSKTVAYMKVNGMIVGDPLTDNSNEPDGYRFHDAFHWAYAAVLGWSPVVRSLLKAKRKTNSKMDEVQDGARATIIEECISFQVFTYAEQNSNLKNLKRVDHDLLKFIKNLTKGLEVKDCAEWEWESAIVEGYKVFRALEKNRGGTLLINANKRSIRFIKK